MLVAAIFMIYNAYRMIRTMLFISLRVTLKCTMMRYGYFATTAIAAMFLIV